MTFKELTEALIKLTEHPDFINDNTPVYRTTRKFSSTQAKMVNTIVPMGKVDIETVIVTKYGDEGHPKKIHMIVMK